MGNDKHYMETVNRLTSIIVTMNTPINREKLFKIIKMLYGLMGAITQLVVCVKCKKYRKGIEYHSAHWGACYQL
jgi:hypothetical protein